MEDRLKNYLDQKITVKNLNADLREVMKEHESYGKLESLKNQAKEVRDVIYNAPEVSDAKQMRDDAKTRLDLLGETLLAEMLASGKLELILNGRTAKVAYKLQVSREQMSMNI